MPLSAEQRELAEIGLTHRLQLRNNLDSESSGLIYTLRTVKRL